jgi:hypothetical protein
VIDFFSLQPDDGQIITHFSAHDLPVASTQQYVIVRAAGPNASTLLTNMTAKGNSNSFDNPPAGATVIYSAMLPGPYTDAPLTNGMSYYYRLRVCDNSPAMNCVLSLVENEQPIAGPSIPVIASFAINAGAEAASVQINYEINNLDPGATIFIKGWNESLLPGSVTMANFNSLPTNDFSHQFTVGNNQVPQVIRNHVEVMPQANHRYYFVLLACNTPNLSDCTITTPTLGVSRGGSSNGVISIQLGTAQVVWDWTLGNACNAQDIPDMPARAVVTSAGELLVTRVHSWENRLLRGSNFSNLTTNCSNPAPYDSHTPENTFTSTPDTYRDREWIGTLYRDPTSLTPSYVHAIIHNEYHDPRPSSSPPCKSGDASSANQCSYFSLTHAISTDGGYTFSPSSSNNLIATSHLQWDPFAPQTGAFKPTYGIMMNTNIVKRGSYYYFMTHAINDSYPNHWTRGVCVARTNNLNDPTSWRFWDGSSYSIRHGSPYATPSEAPTTPCTFVGKTEIDQMAQSLTYNVYLNKFLLIASASTWPGVAPCGAFFSTSDDLITWTPRQLLVQQPQPNGPCVAPQPSEVYPSIIDHTQITDPTNPLFQNDPNFEKSGKSPYLYYTRWIAGLDRDLMRLPITFCDAGQESCP